MLIYFKRCNTKWTLNIVNISKCLPTNISNKLIHLSPTIQDKYDKKSKQEPNDLIKKRSNLEKFSFIPMKNKDIPTAKPTIKAKEPTRQSTDQSKFKIQEQIAKNPEVAFKLARLLDNINPEKTVELITKPPVKQSDKKPQLFKQAIINEKNKSELRNLLQKVQTELQEENKQPKYNFKNVVGDSLKNIDTKVKFELMEPIATNKPAIDFSIKREGNQFLMEQHLKSGKGLQIFTNKQEITEQTKESNIWSMHYDEELKSAQETLPINGFDEMIHLTNEGKLWKFPIDNEQDIDEQEAQIPFHEHVFLDSYLDQFPQIEPIQEFMTLALNGLSQNGFLSLTEKKEIIEWYKQYFNDKEELIRTALDNEKKEAEYKQSLFNQKNQN